MIKKLVRAKEIRVLVKNEIGALARIMSFLVNHGINVEAITGYSDETGTKGYIVFITDNNQKSIDELISNGYQDIGINDVLVVELEDRPGALKNVSELLATNGINIDYLYCTTCSGPCPAKIVLAASDNDVAFSLLSSGISK